VGGMTYSEMREVYKLSDDDFDVTVGSTHLLTPLNFVNSLKEI